MYDARISMVAPRLPETNTLSTKLGRFLESAVTWGAITFILAGYADQFRKWLVFTGFFFLAIAILREHFLERQRWFVKVVGYTLTLGVLTLLWHLLPAPSEPPSAAQIASEVVTKLGRGNAADGRKNVESSDSARVQSHPFFSIPKAPTASEIADEIVKKLPPSELGQKVIGDDLRRQILTLSEDVVRFGDERERGAEEEQEKAEDQGEMPPTVHNLLLEFKSNTQSLFNSDYYPRINKVLTLTGDKLGVDWSSSPAKNLDKFPDLQRAVAVCVQAPTELEANDKWTDIQGCGDQLAKLVWSLP